MTVLFPRFMICFLTIIIQKLKKLNRTLRNYAPDAMPTHGRKAEEEEEEDDDEGGGGTTDTTKNNARSRRTYDAPSPNDTKIKNHCHHSVRL